MLSKFLRLIAALGFAAAGLAAAQGTPPIAVSRPPDPGLRPQLVVANPGEQPVRLQSVSIETEVSGGRAITAVEMVFHNPNRRVLEGELQFPLLDGQQVSGYALDIDGRLRDAVPVEKARGQEIFEDISRQRVDPGLLAKTTGNNYKLRIYPLPAQGSRRVVIRTTEILPVRDGQRLYRLPLSYATALDALALRLTVRSPERPPSVRGPVDRLALVRVGTDYRAEIRRERFQANGWLELKVPAPTKPEVRTQMVEGFHYFAAEVPVGAMPAGGARRLPKSVGLLWDSSGSGAERERAREFALLDAYFRRFGNGEVRLQRLRDRAEAVQRYTIRGGDWRELRKALEATAYDGATQLAAFAPDPAVGEYLLFSDGLDNYGDLAFPKTGVAVHAVGASVRADPARLRQIAASSGGRFVDLLALRPDHAERMLLDELPSVFELSGQGVSALLADTRFPVDGRVQVAGIVDTDIGSLRVTLALGAARRVVQVPIRRGQGVDTMAASTWARLKLDELEGEHRLHRSEIRRLGERFRLVTRETSLIVLDRAEDYARYEVEAPPELKAEVDRLRAAQVARNTNSAKSHLDEIVRRFEERKTWWAKDFPKGERPAPAKQKQERDAAGEARAMPEAMMARPAAAPAPMQALAPMASGAAAKSEAKADNGGAPSIGIRLQRWTPDAAYARRLRAADDGDLYRIYLDERLVNANSSAFFLDVADLFFERRQAELGLRILSNLAEMDLENRHLLRILGYRLMQAGAAREAIPVLQRVLDLAPNEPQSWRDLGLAYLAAGQPQKAVDHLLEVVMRPWHGRFPDIEMTALAELNAIVATHDGIDNSRLDPRLRTNLPLDLRVVLSWDADNTDIDLWVTDPNGEKAFYGNRLSYQGGRMSMDFTGGYGPEEFALKQAKPGKYKVEANFYGHRQQVVAGATTLQLRLATGFGTRKGEEKSITLRLKGKSEVVFVGEFEVR